MGRYDCAERSLPGPYHLAVGQIDPSGNRLQVVRLEQAVGYVTPRPEPPDEMIRIRTFVVPRCIGDPHDARHRIELEVDLPFAVRK